PIRKLARQTGTSLRLLDVATGAGDVPIRLWQRARRSGVNLHIEGCDRSALAIEHARKRAAEKGADIPFFVRDVLGEELPGNYDVVTCSLFLHHLDESEGIELLRRLAAAGRMVLVSDLRRNFSGLMLAHVASRVLTRSPVVHYDAPRSVEAAFTPQEALQLARRAGLEGATVKRRWPCRFLLSWQRR